MRILIVDDDFLCRSVATEHLSAYGHCDNAPNGKIAIELFEEACKGSAPYNLVTMDIEMPNMNGPDVVRRLRQIEEALHLPATKRAKIVMVTSLHGIKNVSTAYYEGCDGYLTKPTTAEELKKVLTSLGF